MTNLPMHLQSFNVQFENGHQATAVRVRETDDPMYALKALGLSEPRPAIFISGGASYMSDQDRKLAEGMLGAVADFAHDHHVIAVDGGTESGVMNIIGDLRHKYGYKFPLIGVSPLGKVSFPGYQNPNEEAFLEDSHSHFVLVDGDEWGTETDMILHLIHTICGKGQLPSLGILINGGKITLKEAYLASTTEHKLTLIVLEGSGRAADEISTAFRAGKAKQQVLQAILAGGDIELVGTVEGPEVMYAKLEKKFKNFQPK